MKRLLEGSEYGMLFVEDDETGDVSMQCLCGGMASWWKRIVLTSDEVRELREGDFDGKRMMVQICRDWPSILDRLVPPYDLSEVSM